MKTARGIAAGMILIGLSFASTGAGRSQQNTNGQFPPVNPRDTLGDGRSRDMRDPLAGRMQEQQAKTRNAERQKRLVTDTEKLLSLATELKQQVDKTDKNTLSVDVIKKADEIEKLAHSVKEHMKG